MADDKNKLELNIRASINTDTIEQDFKNFDDPSAPLISNTGIERDGGITNIYETETEYTEVGQHIITDDGKDISIVDSATANYKVIKIDGKPIGQTSSYGVEKQLFIEAADDVFLDTNSYIVCSLIDNVITVTEYDYDQVQLNTRNITFTNLASVLTFFTSLSFVRYNGMKYSDSLEWALRLGDQVVILQESNPGVTVSVALQSSNVLGTSTINTSIVYNNTLVVAGDSGKIGSFDGTAWKNADGSGTGVGIYNSGDATLGVVGSNNILSLCVYTYASNTYLVVGGASGRVGSWNGTSWVIWSSGGLVSNNATAISTDAVNAMIQFGDYLIIGGSVGKLASWNGTAWTNYNVAGVSDNATLIGAVAINSICIYNDTYDIYKYNNNNYKPTLGTLVVAGASGRVGSMRITQSVGTYTAITGFTGTPSPIGYIGNTWIFRDQSGPRVAYSTNNGITFTSVTVPSFVGNINYLGVYNGVMIIADSSTNGRIATSTDGITWTTQTFSGWTGIVKTITPNISWNNTVILYASTSYNTIAVSKDGINYSFIVLDGIGTFSTSGIQLGGDKLFFRSTIAGNGVFHTSSDGITWIKNEIVGVTGTLSEIISGKKIYNKYYIKDSASSDIYYSDNLVIWNKITVPSFTSYVTAYYNLDFVDNNNYNYCLLIDNGGIGRIATSTDGISWTTQTLSGFINKPSIIINRKINNKYVLKDNSGNKISYSYDGYIWNTINISGFSGNAIVLQTIQSTSLYESSLIYFGKYVLFDSASNNIAVSTDYINWSIISLSGLTSVNNIINFQIGYKINNNALILFDSVSNTIACTSDLLNFNYTTFTANIDPTEFNCLFYDNSRWIITSSESIGTVGWVAYSTDGLTWNEKIFSSFINIPKLVYLGKIITIEDRKSGTTYNSGGRIASSIDCSLWTETTLSGFSYGVYDSSYSFGTSFLTGYASSAPARIATSTDGITWTTQALSGWTTTTQISILEIENSSITLIVENSGLPSGKIGISTNNLQFVLTTIATPSNGTINYTTNNITNNIFILCKSGYAILTKSIEKNVYSTSTVYFKPTNNATVIGANAINAMAQFNNKLVVAGAGGLIGSYSEATWNNYNSGGLYTDNATLIGSNAINSLAIIDNKLAVGGVGGRLGSFNSDGSKVLYTDGTGLSSNATLIGSNDIKTMTAYNNKLIVSGATSTVNSITSSGSFTPFYNDGSTVIANLLTGFNSLGYLYVYRYENGYYHINLTGNSLNKAYTLNNSTKEINTINCRYSIPQVSNGVTRHIVTSSNVTARPIYDGSSIKCTGLVGYTDFATFSGAVVYPPAAYTLGNGFVLQSSAGFGYSDFTFRLASSATNVYNYVPQFQQSVSGLYQVVQSNSNTLINAYGKLTNNLNLTPTKPFEFRVGMINGVQSYLSTAILDGIASDTLGTIITNVGEFDDTYSPMIKDDDKILYLYNNKHVITKIGTAITDRIQKVDTNIYKLNSISPLNIVDPSDNSLRLGSIDYNGRMLFSSTVTPTVSTKIASVIQGRYSNSIDVGDKLVTIVSPTVNNVEIIGYRVPVVSTSVGDYAVDTYFNDVYSYSTLNDGSELIVSSKVDTIYVATTILPTSLGVEYKNGTAQTSGTTIFLKPLYDGYSIGNDITGNYDSFVLFGQLYLFDGSSIYLATVDEVNGIFSNKTKVTSAIGLKYLAVTSTEAYFYSSFDNSLYTFSGGRDLNKFKRMNRKPIINSGVYSTVDNTLLFDTDTSFIWVRDNIITENNKGSAQTNLKYYSTTDGIIIGNDTSKWQYTYYPLTGSVTVPLSIQTSYYGFNLNDKSILSAWVITIYNENKDATSIKGTCYIIDDDTSRQQPINWTINPRDYVDGGYARIRVQPENQRSLGTSLKLETNSKIILVSIVPEFIKGETAVVAKARSR